MPQQGCSERAASLSRGLGRGCGRFGARGRGSILRAGCEGAGESRREARNRIIALRCASARCAERPGLPIRGTGSHCGAAGPCGGASPPPPQQPHSVCSEDAEEQKDVDPVDDWAGDIGPPKCNEPRQIARRRGIVVDD